MAALSSTSSNLLRNLSRPPPTPPYTLLSAFFFKPLPFRPKTTPLRCPSSSFFFFTSLSSSSPSLSLSSTPPPPPPHSLSNSNSETLLHVTDQHEYEAVDALNDDNDEESETENEDLDSEEEEEEEEEEKIVSEKGSEKVLKTSVSEASKSTVSEASKSMLPSLTVKEKKELASYAHSLGKKLKSQQVGKSGVTDSVAIALVETLEANELLKLKIHGSCPGELDDVVKQLEKSTGSVVVGQIGRTVILYRPSLTKMKAEEKMMKARRAYVRKPLRPSLPNKGVPPRLSGRGRRGSSRVPSMSGSDFP